MAIIKFENSKDLVNYLCQKDVLGRLKITFDSWSSYELTPEFDFHYPALDEHLSVIFSLWLQQVSPISEMQVVFSNAEDFSVEAEERYDTSISDTKLTQRLIDNIDDCVNECEIYNAHGIIDIQGSSFQLENLKINEFEIDGDLDYDDEMENYDDEQTVMDRIDNNMQNKILEAILKDLSKEETAMECIDRFHLKMWGYEEVEYTVYGSPYFKGLYDLEDGQSFELDTELLQPEDI